MRSLLLAFVLVLVACGSKTIDLTRDPPTTSPMAGGHAGIGEPCTSLSDCQTTTFCRKKGCGDVTGTCAALPKECKGTYELVCGCDGTTYVNDCVRTAYGISGAWQGPCSVEEW